MIKRNCVKILIISSLLISTSLAMEDPIKNEGTIFSNAVRNNLQNKDYTELSCSKKLMPAEKFVRLAIEMILESLRLQEMAKTDKGISAEVALTASQKMFAGLVSKNMTEHSKVEEEKDSEIKKNIPVKTYKKINFNNKAELEIAINETPLEINPKEFVDFILNYIPPAPSEDEDYYDNHFISYIPKSDKEEYPNFESNEDLFYQWCSKLDSSAIIKLFDIISSQPHYTKEHEADSDLGYENDKNKKVGELLKFLLKDSSCPIYSWGGNTIIATPPINWSKLNLTGKQSTHLYDLIWSMNFPEQKKLFKYLFNIRINGLPAYSDEFIISNTKIKCHDGKTEYPCALAANREIKNDRKHLLGVSELPFTDYGNIINPAESVIGFNEYGARKDLNDFYQLKIENDDDYDDDDGSISEEEYNKLIEEKIKSYISNSKEKIDDRIKIIKEQLLREKLIKDRLLIYTLLNSEKDLEKIDFFFNQVYEAGHSNGEGKEACMPFVMVAQGLARIAPWLSFYSDPRSYEGCNQKLFDEQEITRCMFFDRIGIVKLIEKNKITTKEDLIEALKQRFNAMKNRYTSNPELTDDQILRIGWMADFYLGLIRNTGVIQKIKKEAGKASSFAIESFTLFSKLSWALSTSDERKIAYNAIVPLIKEQVKNINGDGDEKINEVKRLFKDVGGITEEMMEQIVFGYKDVKVGSKTIQNKITLDQKIKAEIW